MTTRLTLEHPTSEAEGNAKRRQIIAGAQAIFFAQGFDAASMGDIARAASVSKGTLYTYFEGKDELFRAIVEIESVRQAETIFELNAADREVEGALTRVGVAYVQKLCQPDRHSPVRAVIAIANRMPSIGRMFYEAGPATGITKLREYLEAQVAAGHLEIQDCEIAAAQFIDSCHSMVFKPTLFNFAPPPPLERIQYVVSRAVKTFMAAYGKRQSDRTALTGRRKKS
jgi:AcrR family transcriptional regulator